MKIFLLQTLKFFHFLPIRLLTNTFPTKSGNLRKEKPMKKASKKSAAVQTENTVAAPVRESKKPVQKTLANLGETASLSLYGRGQMEQKIAKGDDLKKIWITEIDKASKTTVHVLVPIGFDRSEMPYIFARPMSTEEKEQYGIDVKKKARIYLVLEPNGEQIDSFLDVYSASNAVKQLVSSFA